MGDSEKYQLCMNLGSAHRKIINLVGSGKLVLDVGCSRGYLGNEIKKRGNRVFGIEVSKAAATEAKAMLDQVVEGNIEELVLPYPGKSFDVIICADVLEHLVEPEKVLVRLGEILKDNGRLIVSIPNVAHWSMRLRLLFGIFDYNDIGILDRGHLRFFTLKSVRRMFRAVGFREVGFEITIKTLKGFNRLSNWLRIDRLYRHLFPGVTAYQFIFVLAKRAEKQ